MTLEDLTTTARAYVECALWSSTTDDGEPLDREYDVTDIAPEALESMATDVAEFVAGCDPADIDFWTAEHGSEQIGYDFWLTRNGHGAGFWDRWNGGTRGYAHGKRLSDAARVYGESFLYVGDDGEVYVS